MWSLLNSWWVGEDLGGFLGVLDRAVCIFGSRI